MRFTPNTNGPTRLGLRPSARPPAELIPPKLADLLLEHDRIAEQHGKAHERVGQLAADTLDAQATQADADAAATAARAGKAIPAPTAVPALAKEREAAARDLAAQASAFEQIVVECEDLASRLWFEADAEHQAARAKTLAKVEAAASKLADLVEEAVAAGAAHDWLRSSVYYPRAASWPCDYMPELERFNITRRNSQPLPVRAVITNTATAALKED